MLKIAVSKGRIFQETLPLLAQAGIEPKDDPNTSRKLILDTNKANVQLVIIRATDVPTYVEYGAADLGIAGKDVLLEYDSTDELYEPLDLKIARCRLSVARYPGYEPKPGQRLRVATKYINCARKFYAERGEQVEIIKLYGSMELAPLVGLAHRIVDLVDTGNTLRANGLEEMTPPIVEISSRLIVNKASMKMKHAPIQTLITQLRDAVAAQN